jgi:hypothetical protein
MENEMREIRWWVEYGEDGGGAVGLPKFPWLVYTNWRKGKGKREKGTL